MAAVVISPQIPKQKNLSVYKNRYFSKMYQRPWGVIWLNNIFFIAFYMFFKGILHKPSIYRLESSKHPLNLVRLSP
jgi:hypothetical protein